MELFFWYLIGVAAVWRMTIDVVSARELEGPFNLYAIIRRHVAARAYPDWVKDGIGCGWCVSFWFGCAFAPFYPLAGLCSWWMLPVLAMGLSGPVTWYFSRVEMLFPGVGASDL